MAEQTILIILVAMLVASWLAVAVVIVLIGIRVAQLLEEIRHIATKLRSAGEAVASDVDQLRGRIKEEGIKVKGIADYALGFALRQLPLRRRKKIKEDVDETE